jgi:hypothetical protein
MDGYECTAEMLQGGKERTKTRARWKKITVNCISAEKSARKLAHAQNHPKPHLSRATANAHAHRIRKQPCSIDDA